ncbi:MAG: acyltransferase family protein [Acidimicrobiales bacterium]
MTTGVTTGVATGVATADAGSLPATGFSGIATHIPGLDGIRALAVLAVLGFHGGVPGFGGGNIGVDIFFVLSGFLITSLLVGEWEKSGTISFRSFYERRARRLLPALMVLMGLICVYAAYYAEPDTLSTLRGDALSTLGYVANWRFIFSHQSYFVHYGPPSPLLHTWSLAVEEQFYLVWPAVALFSLRHWGRRGAGVAAALIGTASATVTVVLADAGASTDRLYYGTDTRAQEVMIGALLAIVAPALHRWHRGSGSASGPGARVPPGRVAVIAGAGAVGAVGLVWAAHSVDGQGGFLYHGGYAVIALCTAAVILVVVELPRSPMGRFLGLRGLGYIGLISYGLYLYHYPLFLILNGQRTGLTGLPLLALRLGVTGGMAVLSYHLIELPIRNRRRVSRRTLAVGGALALGAVVSALVVTTLPVAAQTAPLTAAGRASLGDIPRSPPAVLGGRQVRVLLVGDSMALTLGKGLGLDAPAWGVQLDDQGVIGCDLDPDSVVNIEGSITQAANGCVGWPATFKGYVTAYDPDVVAVLLGRWEVSDRIVDGKWTAIGEKPWDDLYASELARAIGILSSRGAHVVLFTLPYIQQTTDAPNGEPWDINQPVRTNDYNALIRRVAARFPKTVTVIDLNRMIDPKGVYTSYLDGIRVRNVDDEHFSPQGGEYLRPLILPQLVKLGRAHALARPAPKLS